MSVARCWQFFMHPGPTNIPHRVLQAMARARPWTSPGRSSWPSATDRSSAYLNSEARRYAPSGISGSTSSLSRSSDSPHPR